MDTTIELVSLFALASVSEYIFGSFPTLLFEEELFNLFVCLFDICSIQSDWKKTEQNKLSFAGT